jgi:hypothetical protein
MDRTCFKYGIGYRFEKLIKNKNGINEAGVHIEPVEI